MSQNIEPRKTPRPTYWHDLLVGAGGAVLANVAWWLLEWLAPGMGLWLVGKIEIRGWLLLLTAALMFFAGIGAARITSVLRSRRK